MPSDTAIKYWKKYPFLYYIEAFFLCSEASERLVLFSSLGATLCVGNSENEQTQKKTQVLMVGKNMVLLVRHKKASFLGSIYDFVHIYIQVTESHVKC